MAATPHVSVDGSILYIINQVEVGWAWDCLSYAARIDVVGLVNIVMITGCAFTASEMHALTGLLSGNAALLRRPIRTLVLTNCAFRPDDADLALPMITRLKGLEVLRVIGRGAFFPFIYDTLERLTNLHTLFLGDADVGDGVLGFLLRYKSVDMPNLQNVYCIDMDNFTMALDDLIHFIEDAESNIRVLVIEGVDGHLPQFTRGNGVNQMTAIRAAMARPWCKIETFQAGGETIHGPTYQG